MLPAQYQVSQTVHEHDQALEIVQTVVVRLNATIMEEQDHIDDAVSTRIQRYMRDVQNLRYIMSNFTNIVRKVLKDSIGHVSASLVLYVQPNCYFCAQPGVWTHTEKAVPFNHLLVLLSNSMR